MEGPRRKLHALGEWSAVLLPALLVVGVAAGAVLRLTEPRRVDGWLEVGIELEDLLDDEVRSAIGSGLPTRLSVRVELWHDRSRLWDQHVLTRTTGYRLVHELLEERFLLLDEQGEFLESFDSLDEAASSLQRLEELRVVPLDELGARSRYYLLAEVVIEPLSVNEIRDLEGWIRGGLQGDEDSGGLSGLSRQLMGVLKNQVGLGEKRVRSRSDSFRPVSLPES